MYKAIKLKLFKRNVPFHFCKKIISMISSNNQLTPRSFCVTELNAPMVVLSHTH